jgi:catalase (peroxidase I)
MRSNASSLIEIEIESKIIHWCHTGVINYTGRMIAARSRLFLLRGLPQRAFVARATFDFHPTTLGSNNSNMDILRNMGGCPFLQQPSPNPYPAMPPPDIQKDYYEAVKKINWGDVKADIKKVLTDSKDFWPADYGHYGGFFVRMTWHATGTYRSR